MFFFENIESDFFGVIKCFKKQNKHSTNLTFLF